jgi:hypothetical protein
MLPKPTANVTGFVKGSLAKMSWIWLAVPVPTPVSPKMARTCPSMIVMAAAEMKPVRTGRETNSSRKPRFSIPMMKQYIPTEKEIATAIAVGVNPSEETSLMICAVRRPMIEVGPVLISEKLLTTLYMRCWKARPLMFP